MFSVWGTDNWQHTVYQHLWCSACAMFQILKYLWRTEIIKMTFVSWLFVAVNQTLWSDIASEITELMLLPLCVSFFNKYGSYSMEAFSVLFIVGVIVCFLNKLKKYPWHVQEGGNSILSASYLYAKCFTINLERCWKMCRATRFLMKSESQYILA